MDSIINVVALFCQRSLLTKDTFDVSHVQVLRALAAVNTQFETSLNNINEPDVFFNLLIVKYQG